MREVSALYSVKSSLISENNEAGYIVLILRVLLETTHRTAHAARPGHVRSWIVMDQDMRRRARLLLSRKVHGTLFETSCWNDGIQVPKKYLSSPRIDVPNSAVAAAMCFLFGTLLRTRACAVTMQELTEFNMSGFQGNPALAGCSNSFGQRKRQCRADVSVLLLIACHGWSLSRMRTVHGHLTEYCRIQLLKTHL